jgi:N-acetylglucosamine-6-phosphate deacetylase
MPGAAGGFDSPGYVDLQVNGYAGVDFNRDGLTCEDLEAACRRLQVDGVSGILATVITDRIDAMQRRIAAIARIREESTLVRQIVWGIHIEGPFLNEMPGFIGAHPPEAARTADVDTTRKLLDAADGLARIVTLAPERDPNLVVTRFLVEQRICVSAGHCDPSLEQLRAAIDAGLSMFTHLGNGCPLVMHRHDNIIQRALSFSDRLWIGLIADGVHVPYHALGNYIRLAGIDRTFVVTDAISAAALGPGTYSIGPQEVVVDENLATWAADRSHLMGSASTMPRIAENLHTHLSLGDADIQRLTSLNPRRALQMMLK